MPQKSCFSNHLRARVLMLAPAVLIAASAAWAQQVPAGISNFHILNANVCRGGQPSEEGFANLSRMGVKTILDLRETDSRSQAEKRTVEATGMKYVNIPMYGTHTPSDASIAKALAVLTNPASGKVFVHCKRGADRTGSVIAAYRIAHDGWTNDKALREAKSLGMAWYALGMQNYIREFRPPTVNAQAATGAGAN